MFCSKCGAEIPTGAKFCSVCGTPAPANDTGAGNKTTPLKPGLHAPAPNAGAGAAAKARNNKPLLIGAAALIVVVVLLVVLLKGCAGGSAKGSKSGCVVRTGLPVLRHSGGQRYEVLHFLRDKAFL